MMVWWSAPVECVSALARLKREGAATTRAMTFALRRLGRLLAGWHEVEPSDGMRQTAADITKGR